MVEHYKFVLSIAIKHLTSKKKQTLLVIAGSAIGAMVMVFTFAITSGIVVDIEKKIIEVTPTITIKGERINEKNRIIVKTDTASKESILLLSRIKPDEKKEIKGYNQIISICENISEIDAIAPFVQARGVIRYHSISKDCIIKGIIPQREAKIANLKRKIASGSLDELVYTKKGIILGEGLTKKLKVKYHDIISLTGEDGKVYSLLVVGIFSSGFTATDNTFAFINLYNAQTIRGLNINSVSGIGLHTVSLENLRPTAQKIQGLTGYKTETWEEANANIINLFKQNNNITFLLVVFVFVISGFGISNVLITTVLQKQKDIAIMKSVGMSSKSVRQIFLIEGILIGIIGSLVGMFAGHLLTNFVASLPISYGESSVIKSDHISTVQFASSYFIVAAFSILVSAVSGYIPARKAAKLNPVDILRG